VNSVYLFCLARPAVIEMLSGSDDQQRAPVFCRTVQDVTAVISEASAEEFSGLEADRNMENLEWIGPRAYRHEEVIERSMRFSPVLPARFGTLFSSVESLARFVDHHYSTITTFLNEMTGMEEWSVKGLLDRPQARERFRVELRGRSEPNLSPSAGKRYFQEQQIAVEAEKELKRRLSDVTRQLASTLSSQAKDSRERKTLVHHSGREMVINWALLLDKDAVAGFRAEVDRVNGQCSPFGLAFEVTGPWPPYTFTPALDNQL
jgi:hypothetical protein